MKRTLALLLVTLLLSSALPTTPARAQEDVAPGDWQPDPVWSPEDVVRFQLWGLQHADDPEPDAGIEVCFRFASPDNQEATGPLERFSQMVRTGSFAATIEHRSAEVTSVLEMHNEEREEVSVFVLVFPADGQEAQFVWILSRQTEGKHTDCWMTEAVFPIQPPPPGGPTPAPPQDSL